MRLTHSSRCVISDDFHCTATVLHIVLIYPPRYDTCHCTVCTLISGFAWCYNKPVLSSSKLILKVLGNELLLNLFKESSHLPITPLLLLGTLPRFPLQVLYLSSNCNSLLVLQHQLNREIVALFWCKYKDMTSEEKKIIRYYLDIRFRQENLK